MKFCARFPLSFSIIASRIKTADPFSLHYRNPLSILPLFNRLLQLYYIAAGAYQQLLPSIKIVSDVFLNYLHCPASRPRIFFVQFFSSSSHSCCPFGRTENFFHYSVKILSPGHHRRSAAVEFIDKQKILHMRSEER